MDYQRRLSKSYRNTGGHTIHLTIEAHENRDVMSADVPNAFIQTEMPEVKKGEERVMMKIT